MTRTGAKGSCPEKVKAALQDVCRVHTEVMEALATALDVSTYGSVNIECAYVAGRQSRPQCDVSCMISDEMFREFVVPCLISEGDDADAFIYHLDGPGALRHVEALCEIKDLDLIAWVPGAGQKDEDWSSLHEKIDLLGKGHSQYRATQQQIIDSWSHYQSRKLIFGTTVKSRAEMEDFLGCLENVKK